MPSPRRRVCPSVLAALAVLATACASGSALDDVQSSSAGDGGSSNAGEGGAPSEGGASGDGGSRTGSTSLGSGPVGSTSSSTTGSSTSSTSSSTSTSSSSASSSTASSSAATTTASTAVATSTASGGADPICDPLMPEPVCAAGEHCLPEPQGTPASCAPAGTTPAYGGCTDNAECATITECIDVGDPFALPCCLQYCTSEADCAGLGACVAPFSEPVYADGVEYGVCYDDGGGCF